MRAAAGPADIAVTVVVASHGRPLRLRWLLNALEEQTLPAQQWEVVVVHDYDSATAARILEEHPLAAAGRLRHRAIDSGAANACRQRNIGWRLARAARVAFTDDDCRPDRRWLEVLLAAAEASPGAFVQGTTRPDPYERDVFAAPHVRTLSIDPPNRFMQTCNILYPRALLEQIGGLDETLTARSGEDMDLGLRARGAGAEHLAAPEALVFHAVEAMTLPTAMREDFAWRHLAIQVKRRREVRRGCTLRVFWEPDHLLVTLAALGLVAARHRRIAAVLALPWALHQGGRRGSRPTDVLVSALELPGRTVRELGRVATFVTGSIEHRTFVL